MKVQLNWKESSYSKLPELHIAASEIVSDETFEQMQAHPLWDHDVIQKHICGTSRILWQARRNSSTKPCRWT